MNGLRKIISAISFPGVIFHEFGHKLFCNITGVKVHRVRYFRFGNPAGYVIHAQPRNFVQSFFIAVGPFISGTLFALLFFYLSKRNYPESWQKVLLIWLGFSVAMNCFPSDADGKSLWNDINRYIRKNILTLVGYPFTLLIWLANSLNVIWFDLIYALILYFLVTPSLYS